MFGHRITNIGYNFLIAWEAMLQNKLRAVLTSLGIICGVASVIAMLAIGKGAEQEILEKMKILGTNNVIIKAVEKKELEEKKKQDNKENGSNSKEKEEKERYSPGLTLQDAEAIKSVLPDVAFVCPEIIDEKIAIQNATSLDVQLVGITDDYFSANSFSLLAGQLFKPENFKFSQAVCVIGAKVKTRLFPTSEAVGEGIKVGNQWLRVVGVLAEKNLSADNIKNLGIRDYNLDVYLPANTMLLRYFNRALVTKSSLRRGYRSDSDDEKEEPKTNQIDRIVVQLKSNEKIGDVGKILERVIGRRHNWVKDYEVVVPELLLQQEQSTKKIFNFVLGAIASISLIVGGIGIMNIMLASVLERTKEIGIRRAIGAKQADVMLQFLSEAVAISVSGGIIGIILGVSSGFLIESMTGIKTIITPESVLISFFVSISVGLIFGIAPAKKASEQDPIDLLRYE